MKTSTLQVQEILSVLSVDEVEKRIGEVPGVESVTVDFAAGRATVRYDETRVDNADIKSTEVEMAVADGVTEDVVLLAAAAVEQGSAHPLAQAILRRASQLKVVAPTGFKNIDGMGAQAQTADGTVFLGNRKLMDAQKLDLGPLETAASRLQSEGRTVVHVAQNGKVLGLIAIADAV